VSTAEPAIQGHRSARCQFGTITASNRLARHPPQAMRMQGCH